MKICFLGTNGWYDTGTGNTTCVLLQTKSNYLIFDAGNGFYKIDKYIKDKKPINLFLSHYHLDHIIGLHTLNKFYFAQGIDIYGPPGLKALFKRVINTPHTVPISRLSTRVRLHEINSRCSLPMGIEYGLLKHSTVCYGYRFFSEGKIVAYCTDTGICRNLLRLAKESDLFIAECSLKKGQENSNWPHLNPEQVAKIAKKADAKKLILTHFAAHVYTTARDRQGANNGAMRIFPNCLSAFDDLELKI